LYMRQLLSNECVVCCGSLARASYKTRVLSGAYAGEV
jgi:hypothetical protein